MKIFNDEWKIGLFKFNISDLLNSKNNYLDLNISWLDNQPDYFFADPFIINFNNKYKIFAEKYINGEKIGKICELEIKNNKLNFKKDLSFIDGKHASYPYVFSHNNRLYMIPETKSLGVQNIYIYNEKSEDFIFYHNVLKNNKFSDPSIFFINNVWWIFASYGGELHLWHSDKLNGKWIAHKKNPVKTDRENARGGGVIFKVDNSIYRITQNIKKKYGYNINFNKITNISNESFSETKIKTLLPNKHWAFNKGFHHMSFSKNLFLIDAKKYKFRFL